MSSDTILKLVLLGMIALAFAANVAIDVWQERREEREERERRGDR